MSTPSSPPDSALFIISPDQKAKYDAQFAKLLPAGGLITGEQAKGIMLQSRLPPEILAHIWELADVDKDGKMDVNEFSIALHLIALNLKGVPVPLTLPPPLKLLVEPPPFEAFENKQTRPPLNASNSISPTVSMTKMSKCQNNSMNNISSHAGGPTPLKNTNTSPAASTQTGEWSIPQNSKLKYTQLFNTLDRQRTGFLTGQQARTILLESKLSQTILAQIWNLSDINSRGKLSCEEFVLAMHLVDKAKNKEILPNKLPPDYIPPSFRRTSTSGTLSHSSSVDEPSIDSNDLQKHSFEDKRRENFEKGQAELDRRRAALIEQQRREREERERKEKEENARKEKERLEIERKKQEELERQQQRLREAELEKEEVKRRAMEVKELARKEMERQRQRELEQVKRNELLAQRARLVDEIQKLKSRKKQLILEHEKTDKSLDEVKASCAISREKVVRVKSEIDDMRVKRDQTLAKQAQIKNDIKTLTDKQLFIEQEKVRLSAQLKSAMANTSNCIGGGDQQQFTSYISMLQSKQLIINQLKSQLERITQEMQTKKNDFLNGKNELQQLKQKFNEQRKEMRSFADLIEQKRIEAESVRDSDGVNVAAKTTANDSNVAWGQAVPSNFQWPSAKENQITHTTTPSITTQTKFKYKCLYEFQARNDDEITIKPGDIVMVDTSACSEPEWLSGEINGKIGWFPKDYVELIEDENASAAVTDVPPAVTTTNYPTSYTPASETKQAIALFDYSSTEDGHISFIKDDTINVTQQHDDWYYGEKTDSAGNIVSSGWFVGSYVKMLEDVAPSTTNDQNIPATATVSAFSSDQYYISLYQFDSIEPDDLSFDVNELIFVEKKEGDWWTGVIVDKITGEHKTSRRGVFPSNYVDPAPAADIPIKKDVEPVVSSANAVQTIVKETPTHKILDRKESEISVSDSPKPKKTKAKKLEIVTVIAPYTSTGLEQLSLEVGQLIQVRKKMATGWWEGELQAKGKKKQVGWFPATFVKPLAGAGGANSTGSSARNTPVPDNKNPSEEPEIERVMALYTFKASRPEEMDFEVNDVIRVLSKPDPTWWRGHNIRTDAIGLFPFNHVQVIDPSATNKTNGNYNLDKYEEIVKEEESCWNENEFADSSSDEAMNNGQQYDDSNYLSDSSFETDESEENDNISYLHQTSNNSKDDLPQLIKVKLSEVKADRASANVKQNQMQKQRFYAIYELISTEEAYVKDIFFALENFKDPLQERGVLNETELRTLFSNLDEIYLLNNEFYSEFYQRNESSTDSSESKICDLILHYLKKMLPSYKAYCSSQVASSRFLQQKLENDSNFKDTLRMITIEHSSPFSLTSYLLKPMQRITKYPLLVEKIHEATETTDIDYENSIQLVTFAKAFCKEINDACRESDNFEKLSWLSKHIQFNSKLVDYPIDFNSETQVLGPRQILHAGLIFKASSLKKLAAFLFNDFLLLTLPTKNISSSSSSMTSDFFSNEKAMNCMYKLYQRPLLMKDIVIDEDTSTNFENSIDPTLFKLQIKPLKSSITFRATSINDRAFWIRQLKKAKKEYEDTVRMHMQQNALKAPPKLKTIVVFYMTVVEAVQLYTHNHAINAYCKIAVGKDWSTSYINFQTPTCRAVVKNKEKTGSLRRARLFLEDNVCKVNWDVNFRIKIPTLNENILMGCFEANPFAPHTSFGQAILSVRYLVETKRNIHGLIQLNIPLMKKEFRGLNSLAWPSLLIKYDFIIQG